MPRRCRRRPRRAAPASAARAAPSRSAPGTWPRPRRASGSDVSGRCCTTASRSRKNPSFAMWMPRSFGTWSSTMTRPMPALKPVSTGAEMKLATKPRRSRRAASRIAPTSAVSVAVAVTSFAAIAIGDGEAELRAGQDRQRGRRTDAQHARRTEQRVDHHRHERGVEAHRDGQPRHRRVRHRLGQHDRRGGQAGDHVEAQRGGAGRARRRPGSGGGRVHAAASTPIVVLASSRRIRLARTALRHAAGTPVPRRLWSGRVERWRARGLEEHDDERECNGGRPGARADPRTRWIGCRKCCSVCSWRSRSWAPCPWATADASRSARCSSPRWAATSRGVWSTR